MPKFGWKPDTQEHIAQTPVFSSVMRAQRYGAARLGVPSAINLLGKHCFIRDQAETSACVGFALSGAIYARLHFLGFGTPLFSPLVVYAIARQLEGIYKNRPLPDDGSHPFLAMRGLSTRGIAYEKDWPFDRDHSSRVFQEVPFDIFQKASQFRVDSFSRIDAKGDVRVDICKRALASGHPIPLGMMVGDEFQAYTKGRGPVGVETEDVGGHMTFLTGYEDDGDVFIGCNSWSQDYGDEGFYRIHRSKLEDESSSDIYDFTITDQKAA